MVIAAVLGAGRGARMGTELPKQFMPLGGEAVFLHSLRAFTGSGLADAALLLVPEEYVGKARSLVDVAGLDPGVPVHILPGGETRSATLLCALEYVRTRFGLEDTVLLTHDAARPFVTKRMIVENIEGARRYGAVNTCIPATDTVFLSEDGSFLSSVPARSTVFHAQTPQTFRADTLYSLIGELPPGTFDAMTDGCSVFTYFGKDVFMVRGSENNIKITYPQDFLRAEQILKTKK